jgi:hypothetical protein
MEPLRIMTLDLRSPLRYRTSSGTAPFADLDEGERMAIFELDGERAAAIDIEPAAYLGPPAAVAESYTAETGTEADEAAIPSGRYLFAQFRPDDDRVEAELFAAAALEVQKEGLWQGLALARRVYLRLLSEEGRIVCQVLRPIAADTLE